jgi:hypothetical protein
MFSSIKIMVASHFWAFTTEEHVRANRRSKDRVGLDISGRVHR